VIGLGVDLGGTSARVAAVELATGKLLFSSKHDHHDRAPKAIVDDVGAAIEACARQVSTPPGAPVGVGLAAQLAGQTVAVAPNLGWRDVPFGALLAERLGRKVVVLNDLKVAAWGEFKAGAAKGETDSFTCFVGSGVGSAQIANGRLVLGGHGVAGELGHIKVVPEGGRLCGCGERGCLEAYAGGHKLAEWMHEEKIDGAAPELERLAFEGHPRAKELWEAASGFLALALANMVTVLNPGYLVLGGGVLTRCPRMYQRVVETVGARAVAVSRQGLKIGLAQLGDDAGVVGAALLAAES
jgi:glucokinase